LPTSVLIPGKRKPISKPPLAATETFKKSRRSIPLALDQDSSFDRIIEVHFLRHHLRSPVDGSSNARIGPATANVAGHRLVDILIGRAAVSRAAAPPRS
jgi:hypothetical protein